jgi:anthranilate phosphoribosyltransferase
VHGPTTACLIRDGVLVDLTIDPVEMGVGTYDLEAVLGGDIDMNCEALLDMLAGKGSEAYTALVAINAGALYWTAAQCDTAEQGTQMALEVIKSGKALQRLRRFVEMSHHD